MTEAAHTPINHFSRLYFWWENYWFTPPRQITNSVGKFHPQIPNPNQTETTFKNTSLTFRGQEMPPTEKWHFETVISLTSWDEGEWARIWEISIHFCKNSESSDFTIRWDDEETNQQNYNKTKQLLMFLPFYPKKTISLNSPSHFRTPNDCEGNVWKADFTSAHSPWTEKTFSPTQLIQTTHTLKMPPNQARFKDDHQFRETTFSRWVQSDSTPRTIFISVGKNSENSDRFLWKNTWPVLNHTCHSWSLEQNNKNIKFTEFLPSCPQAPTNLDSPLFPPKMVLWARGQEFQESSIFFVKFASNKFIQTKESKNKNKSRFAKFLPSCPQKLIRLNSPSHSHTPMLSPHTPFHWGTFTFQNGLPFCPQNWSATTQPLWVILIGEGKIVSHISMWERIFQAGFSPSWVCWVRGQEFEKSGLIFVWFSESIFPI